MTVKDSPIPNTPLIELRGVTRTYGTGTARVQALRGLELRVQAREFVAMMGPSGSGKSTCMNILGCLDVPTTGAYALNGVDIGGLSRDGRARVRRDYVGFVFQGFNLLARTTAQENVELPLIYRGISVQERQHQARR
ncbi:MAG: ABC transporter ATP-binding protein, partial [Deltaproteobacteria bacterium]|nr:ABC transporter ATP-binding protein [Deltaproteobacteria bacterium]